MRRIALHLGVHKTGSSYLQNTFETNAKSLKAAGVGYLPLKELRKAFTERLIWKRGATNSVPESLEQALAARTALISDENILGRISHFEEGLPYAEARANLARTRELLAAKDANLTVFLSIRNYADWVESVYLQTLRTKTVIPFTVFCKRVDLAKISWLRLVGELLETLPESKFILWPYEFFLNDNEPVIARFASFLEADLTLRPENPANLSYSSVAYSILLGAKRSRSEIKPEHLEKLHRFVRSTFSISQGYRRPRLFPDSTRERLSSRYRSDLATIKAMAHDRLELMGFDEI